MGSSHTAIPSSSARTSTVYFTCYGSLLRSAGGRSAPLDRAARSPDRPAEVRRDRRLQDLLGELPVAVDVAAEVEAHRLLRRERVDARDRAEGLSLRRGERVVRGAALPVARAGRGVGRGRRSRSRLLLPERAEPAERARAAGRIRAA